jgi:peptidoglycan/LPS O-acetylase OafA/YrhL
MNDTIEILLLYIASIGVLALLFKKSNILSLQALERSSPIDALRGLLATAVVCHHFMVTYHWKVTGTWERPTSDLLNNMGAVPVSLFFMITGFLFFGKIYKKTPDFNSILKSRIARIVPLYAFVFLTVILISLIETHFILTDGKTLTQDTLKWILFNGANFNDFSDSRHITAGAQWTLKYEWLFYLSLPMIAALFNKKMYGRYLVASIIILIAGLPTVDKKLALLFFIGFIPTFIQHHRPQWITAIKNKAFSVIALACLCIAMNIHSGYSALQMLVLGVPFTIISLGNDMFSTLRSHGLKALGEISYSIYLTHGILLFVLFSILNVFPFEQYSTSTYILFFPLVLFLVSATSVLTFTTIERPFMHRRKTVPAVECNT